MHLLTACIVTPKSMMDVATYKWMTKLQGLFDGQKYRIHLLRVAGAQNVLFTALYVMPMICAIVISGLYS